MTTDRTAGGTADAANLVARVTARLPDIAGGSLAIFGDIFGGRIDNVHRIVGAELDPDGSALLRFDGGERLHLWAPDDVTVGPTAFRVGAAARVRWEWLAYGRADVPENWYFLDYAVDGRTVRVTSDVDWFTPAATARADRPAAELVWFDGPSL